MSASNLQMAEVYEDQESQEQSTGLGKRDLLYRLETEQIGANWGLIRQAILKSYPSHLPYSECILTNIYKSLLVQDMECWMLTEMDFDDLTKSQPLAIAITQKAVDHISGLVFLNFYSLYAFKVVSSKRWVSAWERFRRYAKSVGVDRILAISSNPAVARLVTKLGGSAESRSIQLEV